VLLRFSLALPFSLYTRFYAPYNSRVSNGWMRHYRNQPTQPTCIRGVVMSAHHPTAPAKPVKPGKPYPDYPLFPHAAGVWAKKIRGKTHYFGPWSDPDGALEKYLAEKDYHHAGRKPKGNPDEVTIKVLANSFLNQKQSLLDSGELSPRTWREYKDTCDMLVMKFGKKRLVTDLGPDDFVRLREWMASQWGIYRLSNVIQYTRSIFKHAYDAELVDRPIRFGPGFKRPSQKTIRLERARRGAKLFTAEEVRQLLDAASGQLKAMILLGINAGFGNSDCGTLPRSALDLAAGFITYPRPKTGMPRRCPLWPETVEALGEALENRPQSKLEEHADLVFVTKYGHSWAKETPDGPITKKMRKLLNELHFNGRKGIGFYTLRHTFRTIADAAKDQPAADYIMGHEVPHMSSVYRETISDDRLKAVSNHVRHWLFPDQRQGPSAGSWK
jgi:integrase